MKHVFLTLCAILQVFSISAQPLAGPKKIRGKGDYIHKASGIVFPFNTAIYERKAVYTFDKQNSEISVTYTSINSPKTTVTIIISPGGCYASDRLSVTFLRNLEYVVNEKGNARNVRMEYCKYSENGYKVNGYRAYFDEGDNLKSSFTMFGCGGWWMFIRISANTLDSVSVEDIHSQITKICSPANLVKSNPYNTGIHMHIAPGTFRDSLLWRCVLRCAITESDWVHTQVDSMEKISGYPGVYLEMYEKSLTAMIAYADSNMHRFALPETKKYLDVIRGLIKNGYLDEFILDQRYKIMKPEGRTYDFTGYETWKARNPFDIKPNITKYVNLYHLESEPKPNGGSN